jgi:hypothetical protein
VDKKLRAIPEYLGLIRDCVDKYFDDLANPQAVEENSTSTEEPIDLSGYGDRSKKPKSVFLYQKIMDVLQDEERLKAMGFDSAHHFMVCAITEAAEKRGMV